MADKSVAPLENLDSGISFKPTDFPRMGRTGKEPEVFEMNSLKPWVTLADEEEEEE
jgi:hypothetical protein